MNLKKLPRSFYLRPTLTVAKDLLGKYVVRKIHGHLLIGKIVEVEAYLGEKDPASHAYRGKTKRNEVMFRRGGHLYVYFTYGMHFCANIVTEEQGIGHAVLIRALEPVEGIEVMKRKRGFISKQNEKQSPAENDTIGLTNGPAKLCKAFGIARAQNGIDLLGNEIFIADGKKVLGLKIGASQRIGIRNGREKQWRFYIKQNSYLSRK